MPWVEQLGRFTEMTKEVSDKYTLRIVKNANYKFSWVVTIEQTKKTGEWDSPRQLIHAMSVKNAKLKAMIWYFLMTTGHISDRNETFLKSPY